MASLRSESTRSSNMFRKRILSEPRGSDFANLTESGISLSPRPSFDAISRSLRGGDGMPVERSSTSFACIAPSLNMLYRSRNRGFSSPSSMIEGWYVAVCGNTLPGHIPIEVVLSDPSIMMVVDGWSIISYPVLLSKAGSSSNNGRALSMLNKFDESTSCAGLETFGSSPGSCGFSINHAANIAIWVDVWLVFWFWWFDIFKLRMPRCTWAIVKPISISWVIGDGGDGGAIVWDTIGGANEAGRRMLVRRDGFVSEFDPNVCCPWFVISPGPWGTSRRRLWCSIKTVSIAATPWEWSAVGPGWVPPPVECVPVCCWTCSSGSASSSVSVSIMSSSSSSSIISSSSDVFINSLSS